MKYRAIAALGQTGNLDVSEQIVPFLTDQNDILRVASAKALARLRDQRVLPFLRSSANDSNPDVASAVNEAINKLEAPV